MKSLLQVLLLLAFHIPCIISACYNPDGSLITDVAYQPCNQVSGTFSSCCGTNHTGVIAPDTCRANGLCQNKGDSAYWREGCTDPTWKSPFCLSQLCTKKANGGNPSDNVAVGQCSDGSWCCGGVNSTCCELKEGVVLAATIGVSSTTFLSSTISTTSTSASSTPSTSSIASTTSTSATTSSSIFPLSTSPPAGLVNGAKIGIGVGVAGVVLAIIALIFAFTFYRRSRARAQSYPQTPLYRATNGSVRS